MQAGLRNYELTLYGLSTKLFIIHQIIILAVATVPAPVLKLEYRHHTFVWGVVTHAQ